MVRFIDRLPVYPLVTSELLKQRIRQVVIIFRFVDSLIIKFKKKIWRLSSADQK